MSGAIRLWGFAVAALVFVLDQAIKQVVTGPLQLDYDGAIRHILPIFNLRFVANIGVSLGLLQANSDASRWALVALTAVIAIGVTIWLWR